MEATAHAHSNLPLTNAVSDWMFISTRKLNQALTIGFRSQAIENVFDISFSFLMLMLCTKLVGVLKSRVLSEELNTRQEWAYMVFVNNAANHKNANISWTNICHSKSTSKFGTWISFTNMRNAFYKRLIFLTKIIGLRLLVVLLHNLNLHAGQINKNKIM